MKSVLNKWAFSFSSADLAAVAALELHTQLTKFKTLRVTLKVQLAKASLVCWISETLLGWDAELPHELGNDLQSGPLVYCILTRDYTGTSNEPNNRPSSLQKHFDFSFKGCLNDPLTILWSFKLFPLLSQILI